MQLDLEPAMHPVRFVDEAWWDAFVKEQKDSIADARWFAVRVSDRSGRVWVRLGVQDGTAVMTGLLLDMDRPLSAEELRKFPLGRVRDFAAAGAEGAMWLALPPEQAQQTFQIPTRTVPAQRRAKRAAGDPDLLTRVAEVWTEARITHPRSPMKRTADQFDYSIAQMRRLVRKAEAEGFTKTEGED